MAAPTPPTLPPRLRLGLGCLATAAAAPVAWSMLTETLLPLWRAGAQAEAALNLVGLPLILLGVGAFGWGGLLVWVNTQRLLAEDGFLHGADIARDRARPATERRAAERAQLRALGRAWRRGLAWLAGGFGAIALGSLIINWLPGILGLR